MNPGLARAFEALKKDLLAEEGPRISTMRNYRFAILQYPPDFEFDLRKGVRKLSDDLRAKHWNVLEISMHRLLLERLRGLAGDGLARLIQTEHRQYAKGRQEDALVRMRDRVSQLVEGEDGLSADIIQLIGEFADQHPEDSDRTLVWLKRVGALYPFSRSSNLLKYLDGQTRQLPVVLLYPGTLVDRTALSFMGELPADRDYRPRIYSSEVS